MKKRLSFLVLAFMAVLAASAQMIAYQVMTHVQGQPGTPTVIDLQGTTGTDLSGLTATSSSMMSRRPSASPSASTSATTGSR